MTRRRAAVTDVAGEGEQQVRDVVGLTGRAGRGATGAEDGGQGVPVVAG
ncbi:MAG TPA: hypothetical protein VLJ59_04105 [Mycobacteriales bacterium]|nr:hypothetical protein [Mycobacteriales bacterium]